MSACLHDYDIIHLPCCQSIVASVDAMYAEGESMMEEGDLEQGICMTMVPSQELEYITIMSFRVILLILFSGISCLLFGSMYICPYWHCWIEQCHCSRIYCQHV